jgi:hypothetical protein
MSDSSGFRFDSGSLELLREALGRMVEGFSSLPALEAGPRWTRRPASLHTLSSV